MAPPNPCQREAPSVADREGAIIGREERREARSEKREARVPQSSSTGPWCLFIVIVVVIIMIRIPVGRGEQTTTV